MNEPLLSLLRQMCVTVEYEQDTELIGFKSAAQIGEVLTRAAGHLSLKPHAAYTSPSCYVLIDQVGRFHSGQGITFKYNMEHQMF